VTRKAQQVHDKAVKSEHKMAQALSEARHKHELAVASENKAMNDFSVRLVVVITYQSYTPSLPTMSPAIFSLIRSLDAPETPSGGP
jgi:hypothetical protein